MQKIIPHQVQKTSSPLKRTKEFAMLSISKKTQRRCTVAVAPTALILNGLLLSTTLLCFCLPLQIHGFGDYTSVLSSRTIIVPYDSSFIGRAASSSSIVKSRSRCSRISHRHYPSPRGPPPSETTLSMHMGHSHSHHHHHDHPPRDGSNKSTTPAANKKGTAIPRGWGGKLLLLSGRRAVRILFAAMITLLPPALKRRGMTKADVGAFVLTSGILAIFDNVRDETKALLSKGESWRVSWLKHSTPLSADYFFRNDNAADRVTFLGIVINVLLSAGKFAVGVSCHSSALIADAGHSLSDLFSDFVTLWAVQVARLPPDDDHPYGHGNFEIVGSLFLSLTLFGTGLSVGASSYVKFLRVINALIAMTGAEIMGESVKQLTDAMTDEDLVKSVGARASDNADVRRVTRVRARQVGSSALVDVEVEVPPDLSASAMRAIEERIRVRIVSEVGGVHAVEIKATGADAVFCPLLTAIEDSDAEHRISATEVETAARGILSADPAVRSVRGVTVHYQDTVFVRVDANICVDPNFTVSEASSLAVKLRENLESSNEINQANIFLDLNAETLFGTIQESGAFQ